MKKFLTLIDKYSILISVFGNSLVYLLCYILITHCFDWKFVNQPISEGLHYTPLWYFWLYIRWLPAIIFDVLIMVRFTPQIKGFLKRTLKNFIGIFLSTILCVLFYYFQWIVDKRDLLSALKLITFRYYVSGLSITLKAFIVILLISLIITLICKFKVKRRLKYEPYTKD